MAFIVADDSMCYGVNYPLNHVIVFDEMANERSMGALFQLIGRAGKHFYMFIIKYNNNKIIT